MAEYGPEEFILKNGNKVILRHCLPEEAHLFAEFQRQIASETVFTLQTEQNTPTVEKTREAWETSIKDPRLLTIRCFFRWKNRCTILF